MEKFTLQFNDKSGLCMHFQSMTRETALIMAGRHMERESLEETKMRLLRHVPRPYRPDELIEAETIVIKDHAIVQYDQEEETA